MFKSKKIIKVFAYIKSLFFGKPVSSSARACELHASDEGFDSQYSYFLLHASYGDKWCILSYINQFLNIQRKTKIIASENDKNLVRIFLGDETYLNRIVFISHPRMNELSDKITPVSLSSAQVWLDYGQLTQTDAVIRSGFPPDIVRHLHIVKYSYFSDLHLVYGVGYGTLLKSILSMPAETMPARPDNYSNEDINQTNSIVGSNINSSISGQVLFNIVNFSQKSLTDDQISLVIDVFIESGFFVIINLSQHPDPDTIIKLLENKKSINFVYIPAHLLALVCQKVTAVCGVIGGAMNVAVQFSNVDCLGFLSEGIGFKRTIETIYGGRYKDNIWRLYDEDWQCFADGRILRNLDIGDPETFSGDHLKTEVTAFCNAVNARKRVLDENSNSVL